MEATDPQQSYQTMGYVVAGSWGAGLPSFWCVQLPQRAHRQNERQFLVREEHAAQFAIEFPECAGANILSTGQTAASGASHGPGGAPHRAHCIRPAAHSHCKAAAA